MKRIRPQYQLIPPFFLIIALILLIPNESRANAINPMFNIFTFTPDTVVPASILTILIIFLEAVMLRTWIKQISFRLCLLRTTIINLISSAAGSIYAWLFFKEQMVLGMIGLYIPMYVLTVATETPALKFLYRNEVLHWVRSIKISCGMNIISYLFVYIAQFGLISLYFAYAGIADTYTIKKWNDVSLLEGQSGYIYTVKGMSTRTIKHVFNRYDVEHKKWEVIDPGFEHGIDPIVWDIKANIIACIIERGKLKNRRITILNATTFSQLSVIVGNFRDVRISPDLRKLAVLENVREITAPRNNESDFSLGYACKLKIYDLETGNLLCESYRLALNIGLTWTNNSSDIIFSSLRDETLFQKRKGVTHSHTYGRSYAKPGQFPIDLFIFSLSSNTVRHLAEGQGPHIVPGKNEIIFTRESGFYNRELWRMDIHQNKPQLIFHDIRQYKQAVSPSGDKYLILFPPKHPLNGKYFLTVVDPNDKDTKLIIDPNSYYGFRWIQNNMVQRIKGEN